MMGRKLYKFYIKDPKLIITTSVLLMVSTVSILTIPRLFSVFVIHIESTENINSFLTESSKSIVIFLALICTYFIANSAKAFFFAAKADEIISSIRMELYSHGLKRDFVNSCKSSRKSFKNSFLHDITLLQSFLSSSIPLAQESLAKSIFSLIFLSSINLNLTIVYLTLLSGAIALIVFFEIKLQHYTIIARESYKSAYATTNSPINFNTLVLQSNKSDLEEKIFKTKIDDFIYQIRKKRLVNHALDFLFKFIVIFFFLFFSWYASDSLMTTESDQTIYIEYLGYLIIFSLSIASLLTCISSFIRANTSFKSVANELINKETFPICKKNNLNSFSKIKITDYKLSKLWTINKGEVAVVVGNSGSGKSTLCKTISGICDSERFECIIFDRFGKRYPKKLHSVNTVAYLPAYPEIMNGTIFYNITYSTNAEVDLKIINCYLKDLGLFNRIQSLPDGLETLIDGHDSILSTGELQRISILRALISKPEIVILDEATSVLDISRVIRVVDLFRKIKSTIFIVSHGTGFDHLHTKKIKVSKDEIH